MKRILLLGGTFEAKRMATLLHALNIEVIYSQLGLVGRPDLPCKVIEGGFSARGGLGAYLTAEQIDGLLDMTHPYAVTITGKAQSACSEVGLPFWRYSRPAWQPSPNDQWSEAEQVDELWQICRDKGIKRPLICLGQLSTRSMEALEALALEGGAVRTAVPLSYPCPLPLISIVDKGPFGLKSERALFKQQGIDAVICKNSGGKASAHKLTIAREFQLPVLMVSRPLVKNAGVSIDNLDELLAVMKRECVDAHL